MRQRTHLVSHYSEASSRITGPRRLDGRIERQQVGLLGNGADHVKHLADLTDPLGQLLNLTRGAIYVISQLTDRAHGLAHLLAPLLCGHGRGARRFRGTHRITRDLFDRGSHLVDCRSSLFDLGVLLMQGASRIFGHRMQFFGCRCQLIGRVGDALNGVTQALLHAFQGV